MNNEEKILQILAQIQDDITGINGRLENLDSKVDNLESKVDNLESKVDNLESKVNHIDQTVIRMEYNHGEKLSILFDGNKQNTERLGRIEKEVTRQEEIILRKVF